MKKTGNGWKAQLSANAQGKDGPLAIDVDGYDKENGQIVAHDRSDKLDAACEDQYSRTAIPAPTAPSTQDPCNPVGSASDFTNVSWVTPADTDEYTWSLSVDGKTYTATVEDGNIFELADETLVESVSFNLPADSGDMCGMGGVTPTPTPVTPVVTPAAPAAVKAPVSALPVTGPVDDMNIAMGAAVFPVLTYGLLYLARMRYGL